MYNDKINSNFTLIVTNVNKLLACEIENLIGINIIYNNIYSRKMF